MKCESCGKNEAKFHYTKITNGNIEEKHLCEDCASEEYNFEFDFEENFSMNNFFAGLIDGPGKNYSVENGLKCKKCGQTYSEFKNEGKFGCNECYKTFENKIEPLIKGIHGHTKHRGKIPKQASKDVHFKREKDNLKKELEEAVKEERFERAAVLRDELKVLEGETESIGE